MLKLYGLNGSNKKAPPAKNVRPADRMKQNITVF